MAKGYAASSAFLACGHVAGSSNGVFVCGLPRGHRGWHEQAVRLRSSRAPYSEYVERTNWGDDGLAVHASADAARREADNG